MMPANMLGRNDSMVKTQKRNDMKQIGEKNTVSKGQEERMERRKRTKKA